MTSQTETADMFGSDRYFSTGMQLYNWGTFGQLLTIKISKTGHFITGPSGAGKSTILDARSPLMTPPRQLNFNAASRDGNEKKRDRNMVSYIRGTWGERTDKKTGEVAKQHLRPGATWSAIAEQYEGTQGRHVTLAQIYWINGTGCGADDVSCQYIFADRFLDVKELDVFAKNGFSVKALKQALPDLFCTPDFRSYAERFRNRFNIESDLALKLLHKTQSAKNLDDLDDFLRNYMLDRPGTFEVAEVLVTEFSNLNSAHQLVTDARDQVDILRPARDAITSRDGASLRLNEINDVASFAGNYKKIVHQRLLGEEIVRLNGQREQARADGDGNEAARHQLEVQLRHNRERHLKLGGSNIDALKDVIYQHEKELKNVERRRDVVTAEYKALEWDFPHSAATFAMQKQAAIGELAALRAGDADSEKEEKELVRQEVGSDVRLTKLLEEVKAMKEQRSSIPSQMLAMRARIAAGVNASEEDLPFAGELMEVKKSEAAWNGTAERILHGFSLSILVDDANNRLCDDVTAFVNANNMRGRVVYLRTVKNDVFGTRGCPADHLARKINVKPGRWSDWIGNELTVSHAYQCVVNVAELRKVERGATKEGQIKHNKRRHEKDDRTNVSDRTQWVMGFDNAAKLALFEDEVLEENEKYNGIKEKLRTIKQAQDAARNRIGPCKTISDTDWRDIDVGALYPLIKQAQADLKALEVGNDELKELGEEIAGQEAELKTLMDAIAKLGNNIDQIDYALGGHRLALQRIEQDVGIVKPTPAQKTGLEQRYTRLARAPTLANLDLNAAEVENMLQADRHEQERLMSGCEKRMESAFQRFVGRFKMKAGNLGETAEFADDYMALLDRLENDNLPSFVGKFMALLNTQSWQQLIALSTHITEARKEINERLEIVNQSLANVNFNIGTTIRIIVTDRHLDEVRDFRNNVKEALANYTSDDDTAVEERFLVIKKIVQCFAGKTDADIRWRNLVLDVREHVEFKGIEFDADGEEMETYGRDSGKSGGQKQKLAVTCLAAALRYQLGGNDDRIPTYSTIVLDEAFTRSDNTFTQQCMEIFQSFGFQMIIATPIKSVMALEPYVGGATFVTIRDRRYSEAKDILYDVVSRRLQVSEELLDMIEEAS